MFYVLIVTLIVTVATMLLDNHPETKKRVVSWLKDTIKWVAICAVVVTAFFAMVYFSIPAKAESTNALVVAVYYEEDVAVIVDEEGNELLFDRDDLIPGDQLMFDGEDYDLVDYDYSLWYRVENRGVTIAEFLYEYDAVAFAKKLEYGRVYRIETVL